MSPRQKSLDTIRKAGEYQIIYADPPWSYRQKQMNFQSYDKAGKKFSHGVNDHYPTMTNEEIKSLNVKDLAADNWLLFLWVTSPNLDIGIETGKAWGFEFKTVAFVWEKQRTNTGFYTLSSVELCLVFKKGKIPKKSTYVRQFLSEKLGRHSQKPAEIRNRITSMFPEQKKIELFCREKTNGWDAWGNEIINDVELGFSLPAY